MTDIINRAAARGGCPACGTTIPFITGNFRRGRPFACRRCAARLSTSRGAATGAVAIFCLASAAGRIISPAVVMLILAGAVVIEWLTAKVYLIGPADAGGRSEENIRG